MSASKIVQDFEQAHADVRAKLNELKQKIADGEDPSEVMAALGRAQAKLRSRVSRSLPSHVTSKRGP